jgi:glycerol dehydrogenase
LRTLRAAPGSLGTLVMGRGYPVLHKILFPGKYIQGAGALAERPALVEVFGSRGLVLASPTPYDRLLPHSALRLDEHGMSVERFGGECCESELSRLSEIVRQERIDVIVGMGGGKTIDAAKIVADRAAIPVLVVPTIASTDAPCSGCAVVYSEQGVFESVSYQKTSPAAVIVDTQIIAGAPVRFLVAGMGDALATWFEARSCSATRSPNECGGLATLAGMNVARLCYETLLQDGRSAKAAAERHAVTPAFEHIVEANTLLSGIGFESGGLATAHAVHNGLTALPETHRYYHGEKVAFGVLVGLHLTDAAPDELATVYALAEDVGLPTTLADVGLANVDCERLMQVAELACSPGTSIHHEAALVTPQTVRHAMLAADTMGQLRKNRQGSSEPEKDSTERNPR